MPVSIRFLGHAAFSITDGTHTVLVDPFITGNPQAEAAGITADSLEATHIALTHGHEDHVGDTVSIATRTGATVITGFELANLLGEKGLENLEPANPGGGVDLPFGRISLTFAYHSSSFEGRYTGMPAGLMIRIGDRTIYHCGDTGLFGDMKLLGEIHKPDVAIIPIGDRFTMGPADATRAAEMIGAPVAIPCHWNTWPLIEQDPANFAPAGVQVRILEVDGAIEA
ncbi:MAG: metal-dependent hydrolase [Planctomycetaceae bacterium]|nr:metal-dependent hydrolase [Planctomycetaceae bacterium]